MLQASGCLPKLMHGLMLQTLCLLIIGALQGVKPSALPTAQDESGLFAQAGWFHRTASSLANSPTASSRGHGPFERTHSGESR